MLKTFVPRLEVLSPAQRTLWPDLKLVPARFVLYGGTAVAMRLGHRPSADFDFFSSEPFVVQQLQEEIPFLRDAQALQAKSNTLTVIVERNGPVKLSFFGGLSLGRVGHPDRTNDEACWVASLLDVAGIKAAVIQQRAERKDYLDLAAVLHAGIGLEQALGAARALYRETFNPMISLKALNYFKDGDLPQLPPDTKQFLADQASQIAEIPDIPRLSDKIVAVE